MTSTGIFVVLLISHLFGDFLVQTDWQAIHKAGGLSGPAEARRALFSHISTYTLAFVPALIWLGGEHTLPALAAFAVLIFVPHLILDDGRPTHAYIRRVKRAEDPSPGLVVMVDQSLHLICLWAVALLAAN